MIASDSRQKLFEALHQAQQEFPPLQRSAENPHFRSTYAPLSEVLEKVLPILNRHQLLLLQDVVDGDEVWKLQTTLVHIESGENLVTSLPLLGNLTTPQALGSAITYARRYSLVSLLGLLTDDDDDGETASVSSPPPPSRAPVVPPTSSSPQNAWTKRLHTQAASAAEAADLDPKELLRLVVATATEGRATSTKLLQSTVEVNRATKLLHEVEVGERHVKSTINDDGEISYDWDDTEY